MVALGVTGTSIATLPPNDNPNHPYNPYNPYNPNHSITNMRRARWLAPWKDSYERPVIYPVSYTHLTLPTIYSV